MTDSLKVVVSSRNLCPSDKEFNPLTKRCIKKCKPGYARDEQFKCKKDR